MQDRISQQTYTPKKNPFIQTEEKEQEGKPDSDHDSGQQSDHEEGRRDSDEELVTEVKADSGKETEVSDDENIVNNAEEEEVVKKSAETHSDPSTISEKESPFLGVTRIRGNVMFGKELGSGAFGQVYKGQWGNRTVALKKIDITHAKKTFYGVLNEADILESLEWEVSRLSTVSHPNCVQFYGIYEEPTPKKTVYLVMEFCDRGTLESALKKGNLSWATHWQWALEMTRGLAYLHQDGVLHRDLKAENVLLDQHGRAKLADLGVAQVDVLLAGKEANVVSKGLQDLHFISPEKALHNYNANLTSPVDHHQNQTRMIWLNHQALPPENEVDASAIYLRMTKFGIEASWLPSTKIVDKKNLKKISTLAGKKHSEIIARYFDNATTIEQSTEKASFETVAQLCGYTILPWTDTPATDIYALGFVFWQMVSGGKKPRAFGDNSNSIPRKEWITWILGTSSDYEREIIPEGCPAEWKQLILDCWAYDPQKRPSAENLVIRLQALVSQFYIEPSEQNTKMAVTANLLHTCEKLDDLIHPKRLEGLAYIPPYLTTSEVNEPVDNYWQRLETQGSKTSLESDQITTPPTLIENPPLLLEKTLKEFLNTPGSGTLLLLGEAGLGKTLTTYRLADQLIGQWRNYLQNPQTYPKPSYFPLFLRPVLNDWTHKALKDGLTTLQKTYGLVNTSVPLLIIVDGYDECQVDILPQNLCDQLGINTHVLQERTFKILVTCRPDIVPQIELAKRFGLKDQLETKYFLPFKLEQMLTYLKDQMGWDEATCKVYEQTLKEATQLRSVLRNPFVLQLFVQSWETLSQKETELNRLNRWKIYEGFVEHWLKTQRYLLTEGTDHLLTRGASSLLESFQMFASQVAFTAFQQRGISLSRQEATKLATPWIRLLKAVESDSRQVFKARQLKLTTETKRRALLKEDEYVRIMMNRLQQFEAGSPLKRRIAGYEFTHKSFFEYFCAKHLLQLIKYEPQKIWNRGFLLLNKRSLQEESEILTFWNEGWEFAQHNCLVEPLFEVVQASKGDSKPTVAQAASNAITLLNAVKIPFTDRDLSRVQIPEADLSGALIDHVNFRGANLQKVKFHRAFLRETDFREVNLEGAMFGELAKLNLNKSFYVWDREYRIQHIVYSEDGKWLAISTNRDARLWRSDYSDSVILTKNHSSNGPRNICFNPDSTLVAFSYASTVYLWSIQAQKEVGAIEVANYDHRCDEITFDETGQLLVVVSRHFLKLLSIADRKEIMSIEHAQEVSSIAFNRVTRLLASASGEFIRFWSIADRKEVGTIMHDANRIIFDKTGRLLASVNYDGVRLWSVVDKKEIAIIEGIGAVNDLAFDPTGQLLALACGVIRLWSVINQREITTFVHDGVKCVAFDSKGNCLVSGSYNGTVRSWLIDEQKKMIFSLERDKDSDLASNCICIAFKSDGEFLISGSSDDRGQYLHLWSVKERKAVTTPDLMIEDLNRARNVIVQGARDIVFDPTGTLLGFIRYDRDDVTHVHVWSIKEKKK